VSRRLASGVVTLPGPTALAWGLVAACAAGRIAMAQPAPPRPDVPAAMRAIRQADLERDLRIHASDAARGREAGTVDEMRASAWLADELRRIGVKPAGPDGSYFQWWTMVRTRHSAAGSRAAIGSRPLALWRDVIPIAGLNIDVRGQVVWLAGPDDSTDVRGKVAALRMVPSTVPPRTTTNTPQVRWTTAATAYTAGRMAMRGAALVVIVADSIADSAFDDVATIRARGTYDVDDAAPRFATQPRRLAPVPPPGAPLAAGAASPVVLVRAGLAPELMQRPELDLSLRAERFEVPSVNVVGVVAGTDKARRDEYVLFSSHQDHDGVRYNVNGDSVWAGADDNGSVTVALLAAARAFVRQPGKRSALFVWHGAEEKGLLGSRWHAAHPVVPITQIVAVLNGDMIGRNHPDSATLLGVQPPHRNSSDLVAHALRANARTGAFVLDSLWDRPTHPEGWYFRSDHVPYARMGIPAVMFTTNLHDDYHTPRDTPARIDYAKLTRMAQWMYLTGWYVANAPERPRTDEGFKLER
jgi:hypothetical protein